MRLGREDQIRFVPTVPERISSAGELSDLFQISPPSDYAAGGPPLVPPALRTAVRTPPQPRIADAVATAGLAAVNENRRRAVLLVLSGKEKDASRYDPATVRRFLAALRVPLYVWSLGRVRARAPRLRRGAPGTSPGRSTSTRRRARSGTSSTRNGS